MKTSDIDDLVTEVLSGMVAPYPVDIVDRIFVAIENEPTWVVRYRELVRNLDRNSVNERIGRHTRRVTGLRPLGFQPAKSSLIKDVTLLS